MHARQRVHRLDVQLTCLWVKVWQAEVTLPV